MPTNTALPRLPSSLKPTASTFTAGNAVIMVLLNLCATVPADRIIIPTSIHRMKSSSLWICADVIPMPVWSYSGPSSWSVGIHAPSPGYTDFSASRELWLPNLPTRNMLRSLMSRCSIPASAFKLMWNLSLLSVLSMMRKGKSSISILPSTNIPAGALWKPSGNTAPIHLRSFWITW